MHWPICNDIRDILSANDSEGGKPSFSIWLTTQPNKDLPTDLLQSLFKLAADSLQKLFPTKQPQQAQQAGEEELSDQSFPASSLQNALLSC